ncbi:hypothetical protein BH09ACT1_BH09ACT1_22110 [soil metagenome]
MSRTVRDLQHDDVDTLQTLIESVPAYSENITGYRPGPSDALSALVSVPPDFDPAAKLSVGLWDGDELVAFADVLLGYPDPATAYIGLLIVRGDRQREGLGRELNDAILQRIGRDSAAQRVRLGVVKTNDEVAAPFWTALGYKPTGETKPYRYDKLRSTVAIWERQVKRPGFRAAR